MLQQHVQLDSFSAKWAAGYRGSAGTIYCRNNCAGCCHLAVHATYPEATKIAAGICEQQKSRLKDYIDRLQCALPRQTSLKDYLKIHRQTLGPCPFLDAQESCSIYSMRPLSCRALLSTRPAVWCTVDFSGLDPFDKQAYESSLDRQIVAWPTHYVAATQSFGRELENSLLDTMQQEKGWSLSGNLPVMVWLEQEFQLSTATGSATQQLDTILTENGLDNPYLLTPGRSQNATSA